MAKNNFNKLPTHVSISKLSEKRKTVPLARQRPQSHHRATPFTLNRSHSLAWYRSYFEDSISALRKTPESRETAPGPSNVTHSKYLGKNPYPRTDHWFGQGQGEHGAHDARVSRALACVCSFGCRQCNPRPLLRHAPQLCFIRRFSIIPNDWIEPPGTRRVLRESTSSHRLHRTWVPA